MVPISVILMSLGEGVEDDAGLLLGVESPAPTSNLVEPPGWEVVLTPVVDVHGLGQRPDGFTTRCPW